MVDAGRKTDMSPQTESNAVLLGIVDDSIKALQEPSPQCASCPHCGDHWKLNDAVVVILRCHRARLQDSGHWFAGTLGGFVGAALTSATLILMKVYGSA